MIQKQKWRKNVSINTEKTTPYNLFTEISKISKITSENLSQVTSIPEIIICIHISTQIAKENLNYGRTSDNQVIYLHFGNPNAWANF